MRGIVPMLAVGAAVAGAAGVLGCGGDEGLPEHAVAEVGDAVLTEPDFERALRFATGRGRDPRDFGACVAAKRQELAGKTPPAEGQLERRCRTEYEEIKRNVMDSLIRAEWTRQAADARGIVVTGGEVRQALARAQKGGVFDRASLTKAGVSESQLLAGVRQNLLQTRVTEQMMQQAETISSEDIAEYYRRNVSELRLPDRRDVRIVMTRTRARAAAAKAALEAGRGWKSVAAEYSIHFSRNRGGRITAEWQGKNPAGIGAAIFRARRGELVGPVEEDGTWAVFVLLEVKPAFQPTLEQARGEITERLQSSRSEQALRAFARRFRAKTTCAEGYIVPVCRNGPRPTEEPPSA
jgi:foldase protein PrsA